MADSAIPMVGGEHPLKRRRTPLVRSTLETTFVTLTGRPAGILGEKE